MLLSNSYNQPDYDLAKIKSSCELDNVVATNHTPVVHRMVEEENFKSGFQ